MKSNKHGFLKFVSTLAIGTGIGILLAPEEGSKTRKKLKLKFDELMNSLKEVDTEEVKEKINLKIEEIKEELNDLDKEKVVSIAKEQAKNLQKKAEELYAYAVKKATPVVVKTVDDLKVQVIKVAKEVIKNLEESNNKKSK